MKNQIEENIERQANTNARDVLQSITNALKNKVKVERQQMKQASILFEQILADDYSDPKY